MRFAKAVLTAACCLSASIPIYSQNDVTHARPLHVRHFIGTIVDSKGMTVEYATVQLYRIKDHALLASTYADGKGFFYFDDRKYGKRVVIRAFQKGFNPVQYTAMIRPFGDPQMHVVLPLAQ